MWQVFILMLTPNFSTPLFHQAGADIENEILQYLAAYDEEAFENYVYNMLYPDNTHEQDIMPLNNDQYYDPQFVGGNQGEPQCTL